MAERQRTPEQQAFTHETAETLVIVTYLRLLLLPGHFSGATQVIQETANAKLIEHGMVDEKGNLSIPTAIWMLLGSDITQQEDGRVQ